MSRRAAWPDRIGGAAGIAFVGLFVAATFFGGSDFTGVDQSATAIVADLENRSDGLAVNVVLIALAAIAGFWFVGSLQRRLTSGGASVAASAAFAGGIAMVACTLAGAAITGAASSVESLASDPQVAKTLWLLEQSFIDVLIGPPLIVFTLGVSVVALTAGGLPRWLGWSGIVVSVGSVVNTALNLGSLFLLGFVWVLALAVVVTVHGAPSEALQT